MLYLSELYTLLDNWVKRMNNPIYSSEYKIAIAECVFELSNIIRRNLDEQAKEHDAA